MCVIGVVKLWSRVESSHRDSQLRDECGANVFRRGIADGFGYARGEISCVICGSGALRSPRLRASAWFPYMLALNDTRRPISTSERVFQVLERVGVGADDQGNSVTAESIEDCRSS
jgi:hypothetical protein